VHDDLGKKVRVSRNAARGMTTMLKVSDDIADERLVRAVHQDHVSRPFST
jgi:hypothetical protein